MMKNYKTEDALRKEAISVGLIEGQDFELTKIAVKAKIGKIEKAVMIDYCRPLSLESMIILDGEAPTFANASVKRKTNYQDICRRIAVDKLSQAVMKYIDANKLKLEDDIVAPDATDEDIEDMETEDIQE